MNLFWMNLNARVRAIFANSSFRIVAAFCAIWIEVFGAFFIGSFLPDKITWWAIPSFFLLMVITILWAFTMVGVIVDEVR